MSHWDAETRQSLLQNREIKKKKKKKSCFTLDFVSNFCICSQDGLMIQIFPLFCSLFWWRADWPPQASTHRIHISSQRRALNCQLLPQRLFAWQRWTGITFKRMIHPPDFTNQLTDKRFTTGCRLTSLTGFQAGGLLRAASGPGPGPIVLKSCYKTAASEGKAECVQIETRYHLKPSQRGKANAAERGGQMCSGRSALSLSTCDFCLYCPQLTGCWIVSFEEGSGVTVCVCVFWVCLHAIFWDLRAWSERLLEEWVGPTFRCAPVGSEVIPCFL